MYKFLIGTFILIGITCSVIFGQAARNPPKPAPTPAGIKTVMPQGETPPASSLNPTAELETILNEAEKQIINYRDTFKDLLATETKTFEEFDKSGDSKKQTVVESDFLVYQSAQNANVTSELRNVVKVDGKPVPDAQARSARLSAELQKTTSVESELEKIQKEGVRYDKTLEISGSTLFEGGVLLGEVRPYFDFKMLGTENYQGNEVYLISYQQTKKSPFVIINGDDKEASIGFSFRLDLPGALKNSDAFLRGKLWIDAKTYQIRREERELTVQADTPLVVVKTDFIYQPSDYGILVPKQITLVENLIKKNKDTDQYEAVKDIKVDFEYSKFRKTNTDVKILDGD